MTLTEGKKIYFASDNHLGAPNYEDSLVREKKFVSWLDKIKDESSTETIDTWDSLAHIRIIMELEKLTNNIDFSELCITSKAEVVYKDGIETSVITSKAKGSKCSTCWKIKESACDRNNCAMKLE